MFYGIAGIVSLLLSLFFWSSYYSGPYRLVADLQSSLWGTNVINISIFGVRREPLT
jgi:hypothetical protein